MTTTASTTLTPSIRDAATAAAEPMGSASAPAAARQTGIEVTPRSAAILAGAGYVILFALGIFANFFVREGLIVTDDAQATAANIAESEGLFRFGMLSFVAIFVLDIVIAWALYIVFRSASRDLSLVAAWSRLVYTVLLGVALIFFFQAMQFLGGASFLDSFNAEQLNAQALVALDTFNSAWLVGLVAFGVHLIVLGYLTFKSRIAPRPLGLVLIAAGVAYVADTVAHTMLSNYADYETGFVTMVAVPAVIAEGWFGLWLLFRAGRSVQR